MFRLLKWIVKPLIGTGVGRIKPLLWLYKLVARYTIPTQDQIVDMGVFKINARLQAGKDIDGIAQQLIFNHEYEPQVTETFKKVCREGMHIIDVGANIGYYSLLAASMVGANGSVWAFEPEPRNFNDLCKNMELNRFSNILPINQAVTDYTGKTTLYISHTESGEHSLVKQSRDSYRSTLETHCLALDDFFIESYKLGIIKIDTEGNDYNVIKGARNLIPKNPDVILFVEYWIDGLKALGHDGKDLWRLLWDLGLKHIYLMDDFKRETISICFDDVEVYYKKHRFAANLMCSRLPILV